MIELPLALLKKNETGSAKARGYSYTPEGTFLPRRIPERIITEELNLKIYHLRRTPLCRVQPVTALKETVPGVVSGLPGAFCNFVD